METKLEEFFNISEEYYFFGKPHSGNYLVNRFLELSPLNEFFIWDLFNFFRKNGNGYGTFHYFTHWDIAHVHVVLKEKAVRGELNYKYVSLRGSEGGKTSILYSRINQLS